MELPKAVVEPAVLDRHRIQQVFESVARTKLFPLLVLAAATGAHRGELLALQWPDIDFETGLMTVSKSLEDTQAGVRVKCTKSGKPRRFAVPQHALNVLSVHKAEQDGDRKLFTGLCQALSGFL